MSLNSASTGGDWRVVRVDLGDRPSRERYVAFRTAFFGDHLGWKVRGASGLDYDHLDEGSAHYGLARSTGEIVGSIRITPPSVGRWMVDQAPFSDLVDPTLDPHYPRAHSAEISRLGVLPDFAATVDGSGHTAGQALRRAAYRHSVRLGVHFWYVVAYRALIASLRRHDHLPFKTISPAVRLDRHGATCVACLDLETARVSVKRADPAFYAWNHSELDTLPPEPSATGGVR